MVASPARIDGRQFPGTANVVEPRITPETAPSPTHPEMKIVSLEQTFPEVKHDIAIEDLVSATFQQEKSSWRPIQMPCAAK